MRSWIPVVLVAPLIAGCTADASGTGPELAEPADSVATVDTTAPSDDTAHDVAVDTSAPADTFVTDTFLTDTFVADTFVADTFVADTFVPDTFVADTFVPDTFVPDTFVPDTADARATDGAVPVATSCNELHGLRPSLPSGVYAIDPDGAAGASAFDVYCDMETDTGGWTLVLAYDHAAGTNPPVVAGTRPISPTTGFSHYDNAQMRSLAPFTTVRFFCTTSLHVRRIHFRTSDPSAVSYIRGNASTTNSDAMWKTGFTALAGHTATLPAATDSTPGAPISPALDRRMLDFPFFDYGAAHFAVSGFGARWECDDWANGGAYATLHQVWVR